MLYCTTLGASVTQTPPPSPASKRPVRPPITFNHAKLKLLSLLSGIRRLGATGYSPSNSPSFSCVEEAIEAMNHLQSREAKASKRAFRNPPPGLDELLPLKLPLLLLRQRGH